MEADTIQNFRFPSGRKENNASGPKKASTPVNHHHGERARQFDGKLPATANQRGIS
jgi:hypothetical protein